MVAFFLVLLTRSLPAQSPRRPGGRQVPRQHDKRSHQWTIRGGGFARIMQQRRRQQFRLIDARASQVAHDLHTVPLQIARQRAKPLARQGIQHRFGLAAIRLGHSREHAAEELLNAIKESQIPNKSRVSADTIGVTMRLTAL